MLVRVQLSPRISTINAEHQARWNSEGTTEGSLEAGSTNCRPRVNGVPVHQGPGSIPGGANAPNVGSEIGADMCRCAAELQAGWMPPGFNPHGGHLRRNNRIQH